MNSARPPRISLLTKLRLAVLAIAGTAAYQLVLLGPIGAFMMLNPWAGHFGWWPTAGILAFFWWTLQPHHTVPGTPVSRREGLALFAVLDELAGQMGAPRIDEVRLVDDFNAAAVEVAVRWQAWRRRRVLVLGIPLLALLGAGMVRAVVAHELGHFSRRHGRLGQWIYRTRANWTGYAEASLQSAAWFERGAAWFARWFAPRFSRLGFAYSQQCEFEADAYGAGIVGDVPMASALLAVTVFADRWEKAARDRSSDLVSSQGTPPDTWLAEMQQAVLGKPPQMEEWERLKAKVSEHYDTHPSLGERIDALGLRAEQVLQACALADRPAGAEWLGDWTSVVDGYNVRWRAGQAAHWRREHIRLRHQRRHLDALRSRADVGMLRARLELEHGDPQVASDLARRGLKDEAHAAQAGYLLGAVQLAAGDKAGIETLEACIGLDPAWAAPARALMARHADLLDGDSSRERNAVLLARAQERRARLLHRLHHDVPLGGLAPAALDDAAWPVLHEVLSGMPGIAAAWCACATLDDGHRRYAAFTLILRLHTQRLHAASLTEEDVQEEASALLDEVLPAAALKLVWTAYTTEPLTPALDADLSAWARSGDRACLVQPKPDEAVGPGVAASALG